MLRISGAAETIVALGISVVEHHAQLAEQVAKSAMSGAGRIADETCRIHEVVEAAVVEARSIHGKVSTQWRYC